MQRLYSLYIFKFLRCLFGLYLIIFGIKNFSEISTKIHNIEALLHDVKILKIDLYTYTYEILIFEYSSFIYGGLLFILNYRISKVFLLIGFIIEIVLINDILNFTKVERTQYLVALLPLIAGVLEF